jgi:hypothetical protein
VGRWGESSAILEILTSENIAGKFKTVEDFVAVKASKNRRVSTASKKRLTIGSISIT